MKEFNGKVDNVKNRMQGEMNEIAGKILGNEQLELKGKLQIGKADLIDKIEEKMDIKHAVNEVKEDIAGKINDRIDKKNKKKA